MKKFHSLLLVAAFCATFLQVAWAQQPAKIPVVGWLGAASASADAARLGALRQGLREFGHAEGKNLVIDDRYAEGKLDRLAALAGELARNKVAIIVSADASATRAAKDATSTIPIIMTNDSDPVASGFVASLARPGGNITGLSMLAPEITGKRFELLREALPRLSRVAVLGTSTHPGNDQLLREVEAAAKPLGVTVHYLDVRDPKELDAVFKKALTGRAQAVLVLTGPILASERAQLANLAITRQLPAIYGRPDFVESGGLMSYGVNLLELSRRAASYVDKILKGRAPADLPVEPPSKFEFIINLQAAKAIGLTIPPNLLVRADRVTR